MSEAPLPLPFRIVAAGAADIGTVRKHNEDCVLLRPDLQLFLLADGAGGHEAGNVASALATTTVAHHFEDTEAAHAARPEFDAFGLPTAARRLSSAMHRANREVLEVAKSSNRHKGMGTTLVAAWIETRTCLLHVGHVGDSRCYRLRERHLELLTQDHSLIHEVVETRPDMDEAVLARLPRHVVTRALGMADTVRTSIRSFEPLPGDKYLLCSDGLYGVVPQDKIAEALSLERTPEDQVNLLIEMAKEAGSRDNVSAVVIDCEPLPFPLTVPVDSNVEPRKRRIHTPPPVAADDSAPEIVVLEETYIEGSPEEHVYVVPPDSKSSGIMAALGTFIGPMRPRSKP